MEHVFRSTSVGPAARALPFAGLIVTGLLSAVPVPIVRSIALRGIASLPWAMATSAIAASILLAASVLAGVALPTSPRHLLLHGLIGLFSIALPNLLLFSAIPVLGGGIASLAYALPPVFTLGLAALTGAERARTRHIVGVTVGLAGTLAIVLPRNVLPPGVPPTFGLVLLLIPFSIAIGNLLRSRTPPGSAPLSSAALATTAGALWLACAATASGKLSAVAELASLPLVSMALVQACAYAAAMVLFFWLQRTAGVVFTSQVGYIATAGGLASSMLIFGERVSPWFAAAASLIVVGVVIGRGRGAPLG